MGGICPWGASVRRVHLRGSEGLSCRGIFLITRDRKTRKMPKCCILDLMLNGRLQFAVLATLSSWQPIKHSYFHEIDSIFYLSYHKG